MKHIKNQTGGYIIYDADDWRSGLGPQGAFESTQYLQQTAPRGFMKLTNVDPFLEYGLITPGRASGSNATNSGSLAGTLVAMQSISNSVGMGVDAGGKVQSLTYLTNTLSASPHTISYAAGSTYVGQDCIIYKHLLSGVVTSSLFYTAYNSNNWDVGAYHIDGASSGTYVDTFMSGTADASYRLDIATASPADGKSVDQRTQPHPMEVGQDDVLYIGSGRFLHGYDGSLGTNGRFISRILTLPAGFQITALRKFQNILLIAGNYYTLGSTSGVGEAQLYTWDYVSSDVISVTPLEDFNVSAIFSWKGSPAVVTYGVASKNGRHKIKIISGSTVQEVVSFDALNNNVPLNRGVVVINNIVYMNVGGRLLAVGDKFSTSNAINQIATASNSGGSGTGSGALIYADIATGFVIASNDGTPCVNLIYSSNGTATATANTFYFDPEFVYGKVGRIRSVTVKYGKVLASAGAGVNGSLSLSLLVDGGATTYTVVNGLASIAAPLVKKYTLTTSAGVLPMFSSCAFQLSWVTGTGAGSAPTVSKIEIEYELVDVSA